MAFTFVSVGGVADAFEQMIAWLPAADAPLTQRATVLCSSTRAHALRRAVAVERRQPGRLAGVSFFDPITLAREILVRADTPRLLGWEDVRRLRIHHAFETAALRGRLRYFDVDQLRSGRGYADAFTHVIADLEASGLDAALAEHAVQILSDHDPVAGNRLRDVAAVWSAVEGHRGTRRSVAQMLADATEAVRRTPALAEPFGSTAAFLTSSPSAVLLQFISALPDCTCVFLDARPQRSGTQRWRTGDRSPRPELPRDHSTRSTELLIAQRYLFAPSDVVADPNRPRSSGPDGSLDLEAYPSIEEEIEAAAIWVEEQIAAGTALEQIAVVVPAPDPHGRLLIDRLARASTAVPAYLASGLSLIDSPAGLHIGALLNALEHGLKAEATLAVLPRLRRVADDETRPRLSPSRAAEIVYGAGIVGGGPTNPDGALEWLPRLQHRRDALRRSLDELSASDREPEKRRDLYTRRDAERWLQDVEPILPALEALQQLAASLIGGASLRRAWPAIEALISDHFVVPPDPPNAVALIDQSLQPVLADPLAELVCGFAAVAHVRDVIGRIRVPLGRFGEPAIFIGTPEQAAGLPFRAVRVLGLAEGIVPGTPHDDPILPNDARSQLEIALRPLHPRVVVSLLEDRVLEDLHAFFRVVGATSERLALSASRQWVDRSEREVSGVMLEVAAALARSARTANEADVPNAARLRARYYGPSRAARASAAEQSMQIREVLRCTPRRAGTVWQVPSAWCADHAIQLDRVQRLATGTANALTALDGYVGSAWSASIAPGLAPERPISASALSTLLQCPHRFLLENILHLRDPTGRPSTDTIDAREYGSLFHRVAETFFHAHGPAFCERDGALDEWLRRARAVAEEQFELWRTQYPLRGDDSIARERQRLIRQIERLIEIEWAMTQRTFVAAELSFGDPVAVPLNLSGDILYVAGQIDRVDRWGSTKLSVRDLKTGRVRDFREEPLNPTRDLQIGLYVLAIEALHAEQQTTHAAYVHPSAAQEPERRFEHADLTALRDSTRSWLTVARGLLTIGAFPRTPVVSDCDYCPFRPSCGPGAQARSATQLEAAHLAVEIAAFERLKRPESDDGGS